MAVQGTWKKRSELKPGDIFAPYSTVFCDGDHREIYVVIDDKSEVGFWRGGRAVFGDAMPACDVLVLACK